VVELQAVGGAEMGTAAHNDDEEEESSEKAGTREQSLLHAPLARMSDICALSVTETTLSADHSLMVCDTCKRPVPGIVGDEATCQCAATRRSSSNSSDCRSAISQFQNIRKIRFRFTVSFF